MQVTIRTHGGGKAEVVNTFHDGDVSFNEDLQTDDFFTRHFDRFKSRDRSPEMHFSDRFKGMNLDGKISQKIRKVEHSDETTQLVLIFNFH